MNVRKSPRLHLHPFARLLGTLLLVTSLSHAALAQGIAPPVTTAASAAPAIRPGPHQWLDELDLQVRQRLQDPSRGTPEAAEQATAAQITALIAASEGDAPLTQADLRGSTPLMRAAAAGHSRVVDALLTDASVRQAINQATPQGETALMQANFVPSVSLVACQPGTLTLDRAALLQPYVRRMGQVLQDGGAALLSLRAALLKAGAMQDLPRLRSAWLARCPNSTPALQEALAKSDDLLRTLVHHAVAAQAGFNEQAGAAPRDLQGSPPAGMRFLSLRERATARDRSLVIHRPVKAGMVCRHMARPEIPRQPRWTGTLQLKVYALTRAGVVEAVDIEPIGSTQASDPKVARLFERALVRALADYECLGDHVFQQEFKFVVR